MDKHSIVFTNLLLYPTINCSEYIVYDNLQKERRERQRKKERKRGNEQTDLLKWGKKDGTNKTRKNIQQQGFPRGHPP
jgi:hypothetical protein